MAFFLLTYLTKDKKGGNIGGYYLDESRIFLTYCNPPSHARPPRVLTYLLTLPVTLFVSNLFLFYPFSQNFSFQNSLNSKNKKLFVCHQETFFFEKILRTEIFKTSNFGFSPDFKFLHFHNYFVFPFRKHRVLSDIQTMAWGDYKIF